MSPRPPPLIYPRTALPPSSSSSTMAESPRPMLSAAFSHHPQLPPPIFGNTPGRFSGPGPILAPLAIPSSGSGGSTLLQPPAQQSKLPTHIPTQHSLPQHVPSPLQTPHKLEARRVPTTPYGGVMPPQPLFSSPAPSGFSSPAPSFGFERGYGERRFSSESDQDQRRYANC